MPDFESLAMPLGLIVALIVLGWFAWGTQTNVRAGDRIFKWLRDGLPLIGEKTTLHWMGSSVAQLKIAKAKNPYRSVETLFVFEPRDVIFLWAWSRLQGRRDLMIFRGNLNAAPSFELEILDPKGWTTHHTERDVQKKNWSSLEIPAHPGLRAYRLGQAGAALIQPLADLATQSGAKLVRLSVHRTLPNIEAHWLLPNTQTDSARDLFTIIRQIGEQVLRN